MIKTSEAKLYCMWDYDSYVYEDEDDGLFDDMPWDDLMEDITCLLGEANTDKNKHWNVRGENIGWRSERGFARLGFNTGHEMIRKIFPKTECYFRVYYNEKSNEISVNVTHHDSPAGAEWYYLTPAKEVSNED